jgi:hypothetical protein
MTREIVIKITTLYHDIVNKARLLKWTEQIPRSLKRLTCSPASRAYFFTVCQIVKSCMGLSCRRKPRLVNGRKKNFYGLAAGVEQGEQRPIAQAAQCVEWGARRAACGPLRTNACPAAKRKAEICIFYRLYRTIQSHENRTWIGRIKTD